MYRLCVWKEQTESFNHWNSKVVRVTTLWLLASVLIVIIEIRGAAGSRGWSHWLSFSFLKKWKYQWQFMTLFPSMPFLWYIYTYVYSAWSVTQVHLSSAIQLTQICVMYSIITVYALPFRVASMQVFRYGLPTCLWHDSLYIRIIWLLVCLWNSCKPDMVPVSIYVEKFLSESESEFPAQMASNAENVSIQNLH